MSQTAYPHGHHASVLRLHAQRTVKSSAAYLVPYLKPDMTILDVGCGPGSITTDFAATYVPQGHATGLDVQDAVDNAVKFAAERGVSNVSFLAGDVQALPFPDASFDVVHAHQVLQYLTDPVQALREMRRVTKPRGIVAVRDWDLAAMVWWPESEGMEEWRDVYSKVARTNGGEPNTGRRLHVWAMRAGFPFKSLTLSAGTWCFYTAEEREWYSEVWAELILSSRFAETALKNNILTQEGLEKIAESWRQWGRSDEAWCTLVHGEMIARV